ncbi:methyltransferase domain-containing protein [Streptomyces sp. ACA25]|uniref:class I SAM-dependent methyltransferase n=1 Tax=Streptomyces sp. ACA25 TaxID=3022596 RepID=UPI002307F49A|nr:class I SAM-dependent methyltransferase [Streptomyces sp. ACA25]MDB1088049.1 methyltransferase domain-containing protein [Streptomyces sp. ACA25]
MHQIVNTGQAQAWNGYEGRHWTEHQDRWNAVNAGFNEPLLRAAGIREHDRVLDIGCGAGQITRLAARQAAQGSASGLDLSGPMLERATARAQEEGLGNVTFEQGDAQVHPLPSAGFDVALSRFGIMFFADPVVAFANIGRALRPGGRLTFVCMADPRRNEWVQVLSAMNSHVPAPDLGAADAPGMFSLADPERIHGVLTEAGFAEVSAEPVETPTLWGRDAADAADFMLASGPSRSFLAGAGAEAADQVRMSLLHALRPHEAADGVRLRGSAWLVTATRER